MLIYQDLAIGANNIIFEPYTRRILASIGKDAAANANSIATIDPETESLGLEVSLGSPPNQLALSGDGKLLYAGLDTMHAVQQIDIGSGTADALVPLPNDPVDGNILRATEIHVQPDNPKSYVTSLYEGANAAGIGLVANGKQAGFLPQPHLPKHRSREHLLSLGSRNLLRNQWVPTAGILHP